PCGELTCFLQLARLSNSKVTYDRVMYFVQFDDLFVVCRVVLTCLISSLSRVLPPPPAQSLNPSFDASAKPRWRNTARSLLTAERGVPACAVTFVLPASFRSSATDL